jgi:hypothetical protein
MASIRQRFTREEREAFTIGSRVEILSGNRWRPAVITGPITPGPAGTSEQLLARDTGPRTRTVSPGQTVTGVPKHVRLPQT